MPEAPLMKVIVSEHARFALDTLGDEDRRLVTSWFDHLRNWDNDEFVRSHSQRLESDEDLYVLRTSTDLRIVFQIEEDKIVVLGVFRKEALRNFRVPAERSS